MKDLLSFLHPVDPKIDFASLDSTVNDLWESENTFQQSVDNRPEENSYVFYDGPPFATGLPHYGHIMTSIIKDVVPRYQTMKGRRVERRFGWDCHGVPVEYEMEKELGLNGRVDIEEMGVANFNEACRSIVLRYTREWETVIRRVGRWVDFANAYKTMEPAYMESVWWVFKRLWDQDLIYRDHKVVHYSWRLSTPYSNFEATLDDAYRERQDPSVVISFELEGEDAHLLAWTTTPWTLPSNMALAVNPDLTYVKVTDEKGTFILARDQLENHFDQDNVTIIKEALGSTLIGRRYQPILPYFADKALEGAFKVLGADFVSAEDGTGIVHLAPAFGEDDFDVARRDGVPLVNPVDDEGNFTSEVPDFVGQNVFEANPNIIRHLKHHGSLFSQSTVTHSYPHDWRTDTPLIYRAIPSWFVRTTEIKEKILSNNQKMNWYPGHVKDGAFGNWLDNIRDWASSRNRFWGAPIPLWECEKCKRHHVIGSIAELKERSGIQEITDLHSHHIDAITIPCDECGSTMNRIPEVLDCWFESGSMPYAQVHYPFNNDEWFDTNFPADFIVEYIGQTRGWFYTLLVLSAALFDKPVALNSVAHGILLGDDGRKMSKRLRNYPDVNEMLDKYGADALRLYLAGHPSIDGVDSSVTEDGIAEMLRRFVLPVWNAFSFFTRYAAIDNWRPGNNSSDFTPTNLDRWIRSRTAELSHRVDEALASYQLRNAVQLLLDYVDELNNWYIRRSRDRFWRSGRDADKLAAYDTLYEVLVTLSGVAAPLVPFLTEVMYRNLTGSQSIHLADWPAAEQLHVDTELNHRMAAVRDIASLGLEARARTGVRVRQPLAQVSIRTSQSLEETDIDLLKDELNVHNIELLSDVSNYAEEVYRPQGHLIGSSFGKATSQIIKAIKKGDFEITPEGSYVVSGDAEWILDPQMIDVHYDARDGFACETKADLVVILDLELTEELKLEGLAREIIRHLQTLRKEADYQLDDRINVGVVTKDERIKAALNAFGSIIQAEVLAETLDTDKLNPSVEWDQRKSFVIEEAEIRLAIRRTA